MQINYIFYYIPNKFQTFFTFTLFFFQFCIVLAYSYVGCAELRLHLGNKNEKMFFHFVFRSICTNFATENRKRSFMRIDIITVLPELIEPFTQESILGRAQKKGLAEIHVHNLRDYTADKHRRVDDYPFGGAAGMLIQCQPLDACISALKAERHYDEIIFTAPDGEKFDQPMANELSLKENIIIICGHYKGIDYRIREHLITKEVSIGDYVLTGGELAAAVMADSIVRVIPGVIGDVESALSDSFQDNLLEPPVYTRPAEYHPVSNPEETWAVPEILLSGHEAKIKEWEYEQALKRTKALRPDLLESDVN